MHIGAEDPTRQRPTKIDPRQLPTPCPKISLKEQSFWKALGELSHAQIRQGTSIAIEQAPGADRPAAHFQSCETLRKRGNGISVVPRRCKTGIEASRPKVVATQIHASPSVAAWYDSGQRIASSGGSAKQQLLNVFGPRNWRCPPLASGLTSRPSLFPERLSRPLHAPPRLRSKQRSKDAPIDTSDRCC